MRTTRNKLKNEGIGAVRLKLGLSQAALAEVLQITRSALVMNEHRQRTLSGPALLKVAMLEIKLAATPAFHRAELEPHPVEELNTSEMMARVNKMLERESRCHIQADKLVEKISAITDTYKRTRHWLHIIEQSLSDDSFTLANEADWWRTQRSLALARLATCDTPIQMLLQNEIDMLRGEADVIKKLRLQLPGN